LVYKWSLGGHGEDHEIPLPQDVTMVATLKNLTEGVEISGNVKLR